VRISFAGLNTKKQVNPILTDSPTDLRGITYLLSYYVVQILFLTHCNIVF
jgi:hypothetical protein